MALIKCPECGKEISDNAKACPNCGCALKSSSSSFALILISCVISALLLLVSFGGLSNSFQYVMGGSGSIAQLFQVAANDILIFLGGVLSLIAAVMQIVSSRNKNKSLNTASVALSIICFAVAALVFLSFNNTYIIFVPAMVVPPILLLVSGRNISKSI